jgi:hypothetical protein
MSGPKAYRFHDIDAVRETPQSRGGGCGWGWLNSGFFALTASDVASCGRPIANRPQVANLPHKIVAAHEERDG